MNTAISPYTLLSLHIHHHLSIYSDISLSTPQSLCLHHHLSISQSTLPSLNLHCCLSIYTTVSPSTPPFLHLHHYLHLQHCLSIYSTVSPYTPLVSPSTPPSPHLYHHLCISHNSLSIYTTISPSIPPSLHLSQLSLHLHLYYLKHVPAVRWVSTILNMHRNNYFKNSFLLRDSNGSDCCWFFIVLALKCCMHSQFAAEHQLSLPTEAYN